jgi:hypothetical protein
MTDVHVFFFTRSVGPTEPQVFYRMLRRHLPGACPATFHKHEDVLIPFTDENLPQFAAMWWQGFVFWESDSDTRGDAFIGTKFKVTKIVHTFPTKLPTDRAVRIS